MPLHPLDRTSFASLLALAPPQLTIRLLTPRSISCRKATSPISFHRHTRYPHQRRWRLYGNSRHKEEDRLDFLVYLNSTKGIAGELSQRLVRSIKHFSASRRLEWLRSVR